MCHALCSITIAGNNWMQHVNMKHITDNLYFKVRTFGSLDCKQTTTFSCVNQESKQTKQFNWP